MHRRSVSSSSTSSYAGPSRFRAEAEAQHPKAGFAHTPNSLSEDQIVCQTKLFDAFELQELEQQLDRKLNLVNHQKSLSFCSESPNYEKSLVSVSNLLNDRLLPADQLQENAGCACNSCNDNVKTPSLSSFINDSAIPKCKQSLITASNMLMQPDHVHGGCSCNRPANMYDQLHDEKTASYVHRSYSTPRSHYNDIKYAGDHSQAERACLGGPAQEALQDLQVHADQRAIISSKTKELKVQKQIRAKSSRWSLANSLFRSLKAMHKVRFIIFGCAPFPLSFLAL